MIDDIFHAAWRQGRANSRAYERKYGVRSLEEARNWWWAAFLVVFLNAASVYSIVHVREAGLWVLAGAAFLLLEVAGAAAWLWEKFEPLRAAQIDHKLGHREPEPDTTSPRIIRMQAERKRADILAEYRRSAFRVDSHGTITK
ncbi:hypothetical protein [Amnibacterium setariae]|uniref:2TM domain-containing protein n=1 Tax=Amnibacterium setariae TaxID=2306585 RepID=A0A3A1TZM8_9MICO|nr:hypothetical protein [Amnibacterium setariae]RIX30155.1 hypothetical protein D1781_01510 [Amnibacterium setariae]